LQDLAHPKIWFSPFSFFSAAKSELFWHILPDCWYGNEKNMFLSKKHRKQVEIVNARSVDIWDLSMADCEIQITFYDTKFLKFL